MRFMLLVPGDKNSEAGVMPSKEDFETMGKFNEEMAKAGVLLAADGLHPTSKGAKIVYRDGKTEVMDGPFTETKELIAGYWIIKVKSKEEALGWARRAPFGGGVTLELRQIFDPEDFAAVDPTGELRAKEQALRETVSKRQG